jgi:outer membrane protein assembly factor BamB
MADGWNMFRNGPTGVGTDSLSFEPPVDLAWVSKFKGRLYATPIINNGLGVMPGLDKKIHLFDPETGKISGRIKTKSSSSSTPAIAENLLYIASEKGDGRLRCINLKSGDVVWEKRLGDISAPIVLHDRSLFIGNYAGEFYCINRFTGDVNWLYKTGGPILGGAAANEERVFIGSSDASLYCFDLSDGKELWRYQTGGAVVSTPAIGRYCFFGSQDHNMYAVGINTGNEVWRFQTGGQIFSSPVIDGDAVYFGSNDRYFYSLSLISGYLRWEFMTDAIVNGAALVMSNAVIFGSGDKHVYFLDKRTGSELDRFETRSRVVSSPVYYRGRVYVACAENRLYCFEDQQLIPAENASVAP